MREKRKRVEASRTERVAGPARPPVPRRPRGARAAGSASDPGRAREGTGETLGHTTSPEAEWGGVKATRSGHLGPRY